jgi:hypothetical protein
MTGILITLAVFIGTSARIAISRPVGRCFAWNAVWAGRESRMARTVARSATESSPTRAGGAATAAAAPGVAAGVPAVRAPFAGRAVAGVAAVDPGARCPAQPRAANTNVEKTALRIRCMANGECVLDSIGAFDVPWPW